MESNVTQIQETSVFINDVRISLSKDQQYLLIFLPGNQNLPKAGQFFQGGDETSVLEESYG